MRFVDADVSILGEHWRRHEIRQASLEPMGAGLRLVVSGASARQYSNAQIDDYSGQARRRDFPWRPPLRLTVRARFSHPAGQLKGTAGFGFWNDPFLMTGVRVPALPQAVWFFYASPPANIKLDARLPGHGWKAASIDAGRPEALLLVPLAPVAVPLMSWRPVYHALWPRIQHALRIGEVSVGADMTAWHSYALEWGARRARFLVDGRAVGHDLPSPRGPLGFVAWLDNQYLVATPQGRFRWGLLDVPDRQWLEIERLTIEVPEDHDHMADRTN